MFARSRLLRTTKQNCSRRTTFQNRIADISFAFYRKHTEKMLRRYLYASMLVGRAPAILGEPIGRGWVSSRKVKTFEDAVIFVLDIERCLKKLTPVRSGDSEPHRPAGVHLCRSSAHPWSKRARHILQIQASARQPHRVAPAIGPVDPSAFIVGNLPQQKGSADCVPLLLNAQDRVRTSATTLLASAPQSLSCR